MLVSERPVLAEASINGAEVQVEPCDALDLAAVGPSVSRHDEKLAERTDEARAGAGGVSAALSLVSNDLVDVHGGNKRGEAREEENEDETDEAEGGGHVDRLNVYPLARCVG